MFEKTSRLAEQVASSVSRRGFLCSLGGWAATAALGVAGVLAGKSARADSVGRCCRYYCTCTSVGCCRRVWLKDPKAACPTTNCDGWPLSFSEKTGKSGCCGYNSNPCCP
jgi:hypothetical protein